LFYESYFISLLEEHSNYNITASSLLFDSDYTKYFNRRTDLINQLQVSVYTNIDIVKFENYQKLFLIKDYNSFVLSNELMNEMTGKLHFLIDQNLIRQSSGKQFLADIIKNFHSRKDKQQSCDTCLTSWVVNGHCPYENSNYIDITFDNTIRKCPYAKKGIKVNSVDLSQIESYMKLNLWDHIDIDPTFKCIYHELFKGEIDESKYDRVQNKDANNSSRSSSKRVWGFSLRRNRC
jgi:hypothetical protein